jgi:hypothetical protein
VHPIGIGEVFDDPMEGIAVPMEGIPVSACRPTPHLDTLLELTEHPKSLKDVINTIPTSMPELIEMVTVESVPIITTLAAVTGEATVNVITGAAHKVANNGGGIGYNVVVGAINLVISRLGIPSPMDVNPGGEFISELNFETLSFKNDLGTLGASITKDVAKTGTDVTNRSFVILVMGIATTWLFFSLLIHMYDRRVSIPNSMFLLIPDRLKMMVGCGTGRRNRRMGSEDYIPMPDRRRGRQQRYAIEYRDDSDRDYSDRDYSDRDYSDRDYSDRDDSYSDDNGNGGKGYRKPRASGCTRRLIRTKGRRVRTKGRRVRTKGRRVRTKGRRVRTKGRRVRTKGRRVRTTKRNR